MSADSMANDLMKAVEALGPLREAAKGYRNQLISDGWSAESADKIAAELHIIWLKLAIKPVAGD